MANRIGHYCDVCGVEVEMDSNCASHPNARIVSIATDTPTKMSDGTSWEEIAAMARAYADAKRDEMQNQLNTLPMRAHLDAIETRIADAFFAGYIKGGKDQIDRVQKMLLST